MTRALVQFNVDPIDGDSYDQVRSFTYNDNGGDIQARFQSIQNACKFDLSNRMDDLLELATCCLETDKTIRRGSETDLSLSEWERHIHVRSKVSDAQFWNDRLTRNLLQEYLNFLTGDFWTFEFLGGKTSRHPDVLFKGDWQNDHCSRDSVLLFSGGQDSLACLLQELEIGGKPILASHASDFRVSAAQRNIVGALSSGTPPQSLPYIAYFSRSGEERPERTQRSRGFLYGALGSAIAAGNGINRVILSDNGIISLNLPASAQSILGRNSRATHPKSLHLLQQLVQHVSGQPIMVENPIRFHTRADVIGAIDSKGPPGLLELTVSCARGRHTTLSEPHCGTCSQCVDRRFGAEIAGSTTEPTGRYKKDVFEHELNSYKDKMQAFSYVTWAQEVSQLSEQGLFEKHPELGDILALPDADPTVDGPRYVDLLRRHSKGVLDLLNRKLAEAQLASSTLPDSCLLRLIASRQHLDARAEYINTLRPKLSASLPTLSNWKTLKSEAEVQMAIGALLKMDDSVEFDREVPLLPFAGISVKPDLTSTDFRVGWLYIEAKYPRERRHVNGMITEITSRILVYRQLGAQVLFVIADPNSVIPNPEKLLATLGVHEGCWFIIIR